MSRPKKPKRKVRVPKLCRADYAIYILLLVLSGGLIFLPFILMMLWQNHAFLASGEVLAYTDSPWLLLVLLLLPPFFIPPVLVLTGMNERRPIVGPKPVPKDAPIAGKKTPPSAGRRRRRVWIPLLIAVYILLCVPAVGSIFARTEITATEVREYTLFGIETGTTPLTETAAVETQIYWQSARSGGSWAASYTITMQDGEEYHFIDHPLTLLEIDRHIPPCPRTSDGTEDFDKLCREYDLTPEEADRVRVLFRTTG